MKTILLGLLLYVPVSSVGAPAAASKKDEAFCSSVKQLVSAGDDGFAGVRGEESPMSFLGIPTFASTVQIADVKGPCEVSYLVHPGVRCPVSMSAGDPEAKALRETLTARVKSCLGSGPDPDVLYERREWRRWQASPSTRVELELAPVTNGWMVSLNLDSNVPLDKVPKIGAATSAAATATPAPASSAAASATPDAVRAMLDKALEDAEDEYEEDPRYETKRVDLCTAVKAYVAAAPTFAAVKIEEPEQESGGGWFSVKVAKTEWKTTVTPKEIPHCKIWQGMVMCDDSNLLKDPGADHAARVDKILACLPGYKKNVVTNEPAKMYWVTRLEKAGSPTINTSTQGAASDKLSKFSMTVWGK